MQIVIYELQLWEKWPIGGSLWNHWWSLGIGIPTGKAQAHTSVTSWSLWCLQKSLSGYRWPGILLLELKLPPPLCWYFCFQSSAPKNPTKLSSISACSCLQTFPHRFLGHKPQWWDNVFPNPWGQLKALVMLLASNVFITYNQFSSSICCRLLEIHIE